MKQYDTLHAMANEAIHKQWIPGYAMQILNKNETDTTWGGYASENGFPIDTHSLYDIASLTKLFVATRILQLIDQGSLSLTISIQSILPNFTINDITIGECLTHTSGFIPSVSGRYSMNAQEIIQSILNAEDYVANQYGEMVYSCINFILLGMVLEAIDGSLEKSLSQGIWEPLQMTQTRFRPDTSENIVPTEVIDGILMQGMVHDETARALGGVAGNAGIFSSLHDMSLFTKAYLKADGPVITKNMVQSIQDTNIKGRSLGWNLFPNNGRAIPFHTGFTGPILCIDFTCQRAFLLLTNRVYPTRVDTGFIEHRDEMVEIFLNT